MAEQKEPPSAGDLAALLTSDPKREAVATLRGFDWQRWATVERWLKLENDDALFIEWGEDFATIRDEDVRAYQAKDLSRSISLGQKPILAIISRALVRPDGVTTVVLTRAGLAVERKNPFGEAGVLHWRRVVSGETNADLLIKFLSAGERLKRAAKKRVREADPTAAAALFSKVQWVTGEPDIAGLRERVEARIEARMKAIGLPDAAVQRDEFANHLFVAVAEIGLSPERNQRRLTRNSLDKCIQSRTLGALASSAMSFIKLMAAESEAKGAAAASAALGVGVTTLPSADALARIAHVLPPGLDLAAPLARDLAERYRRTMRQMLFTEHAGKDLFANLADTALSAEYAHVDPALRRRIVLRAARSAAVNKDVERAEALVVHARRVAGDDTDRLARARILQARGDIDGAIQLVRDETSSDARSVVLSLLSGAGRDEDAFAWIEAENISADMLTDAGVHVLAHLYLKRDDFAGLETVTEAITAAQCADGPQLLFLRGVSRFASVFPEADRHIVFKGVPAGAKLKEPAEAGFELAERLARAIDDFDRVLTLEHDLDLSVTARTVERNRRWCELLHPQRRAAARARLDADLNSPATAVAAVPFACALDVAFDHAPIHAWLARREKLGGWSGEELAAAFTLRIEEGEPIAIASFIEQRRESLERYYEKSSIYAAHIGALTEASQFGEARAALAALPDGVLEDRRPLMRAAIDAAEGADPVEVLKIAYEESDSEDALRALIDALGRKGDRLALAYYARVLFDRTGKESDLYPAARALASIGNEAAFLALVDMYPGLEAKDPDLLRHHAAVLYKRGKSGEASAKAAELAALGEDERALDLEIAIAVETGDWGRLGALTGAYLAASRKSDGEALIRAAITAQVAGAGPMLDLLDAAVKQAPDDPQVLMGAYTLVAEEGLEDKRPEAEHWLKQAIDLSDEDGPVKRYDIKELLAEQKSWISHLDAINESMAQGQMPLAIAARGLRTTLVDLVLRNFARNSALADPRRRASLPLFAGNRTGEAAPQSTLAAFDLTALITLGWLGLLPQAFGFYPKVLLPAGGMTELFEGRQRIRRTQQSRLRDAAFIRDALAGARIKMQPTSPSLLVGELDQDLASLIDAAARAKGAVVRPAPVHPPGDLETELDMSAHAGVLTDMHGLLAALSEAGALTAAEEERAQRYFTVQDKGWGTKLTLDPDQPLFLDSLAVAYLQGARLFEQTLHVFGEVYIEQAVADEAFALLENETYVSEVLAAIEAVRTAVRDAIASGKATFGASRIEADGLRFNSSTMNLLADLKGADLFVADDRALNKEAFAQDGGGKRARVATTLEVLLAMREGGAISDAEWRAARHKLRVVGASLMPVTAEEVAAAALRNKAKESAEFRAIRESLQLARMARAARFPPEVFWFAHLSLAIKNAVKIVWRDEPDRARAAELAFALIRLLPIPDDWRDCWIGEPPSDWAASTDVVMLSSLAMPLELSGEDRDTYNEWFETEILAPMRLASPARYAALVAQVKAFTLDADENDE